MGEYTEKQLIEELYELEKPELFVLLLNYYSKMKNMEKDMVDCLNLLDELTENSNKKREKEKIRKLILDNFNELPRSTKELYCNIAKILKEE